jgi:two-component system phosphate regulon response regulator PhoB
MTGQERPAVLIVDDEPAIGRVIAVIVSSLGCETVLALSAEEALLKLPNIEPKMMLVDVRLPGIDGIEFVRRMREDRRYSAVPIYLMSAFAEPPMHAGDGFVPKPFDIDRLSDLVEHNVYRDDDRFSS